MFLAEPLKIQRETLFDLGDFTIVFTCFQAERLLLTEGAILAHFKIISSHTKHREKPFYIYA